MKAAAKPGWEELKLDGSEKVVIIILTGMATGTRLVERFARTLNSKLGFCVRVIPLGGHTGHWNDFKNTSAWDWIDNAQKRFAVIRAAHNADTQFIVLGYSAGFGAAVAVAHENSDVRIVGINPLLKLPNPRHSIILNASFIVYYLAPLLSGAQALCALIGAVLGFPWLLGGITLLGINLSLILWWLGVRLCSVRSDAQKKRHEEQPWWDKYPLTTVTTLPLYLWQTDRALQKLEPNQWFAFFQAANDKRVDVPHNMEVASRHFAGNPAGVVVYEDGGHMLPETKFHQGFFDDLVVRLRSTLQYAKPT